MRRKSNDETLGEVITQLLKAYGLEDRMTNHLIIQAWEKMMGGFISRKTESINIHKGVLHISLTSSVIRQELSMGKEKIIEELNKQLGGKAIKEIRFR
jgi:hypothetical protein